MNAPAHKARRFPPPWSVQKTAGGHFQVVDANGVTLAYVYVRDERSSYDGLTEDQKRLAASQCSPQSAAPCIRLRVRRIGMLDALRAAGYAEPARLAEIAA